MAETQMAWRLPYNGKQQMKFAAGAAGVIDNGRLFVVDVVRGSFKPSVLAHRVAQMAKKHGVHHLTIEDTPGARFYEASIQNYALMLGHSISIAWVEFQEDDGIRDLRLKALEPMIAATRVCFSSGIATTAMKDLTRQFCHYGMVDENEIVDVVARLSERLPKSIAATADQEQDLNWELAKARDLFNRTHGLGKYAPAEAVAPDPYREPTNAYGLTDVLGGLNG